MTRTEDELGKRIEYFRSVAESDASPQAITYAGLGLAIATILKAVE